MASQLGLGDFVRRAKVLGLYRRLLRAVQQGNVEGGREQVSAQFRAFRNLSPSKDKATIAQLLREGEKQAEMVEGVRGVGKGGQLVAEVLEEEAPETPKPSTDDAWPWSR